MNRITRTLALALALCVTAVSSAAASSPDRQQFAAYADGLLAQYPADGPGIAVLVVRGDEVLYRDARGMASLELDVALQPEHVFRIASVTKQFGGAAILRLVDEGRLSLSDPLSKFLPDYPDADNITVRMLLDHTSGIRNYTTVPGWMDTTIKQDWTTQQMVEAISAEPPDFAPGEDWSYSNSAYVLAGAVIEQVTGQDWHAYLHDAFFVPLGMADSGYGDPGARLIQRLVPGYSRSGDKDEYAAAAYLSMTQPHIAGALVSSLDDLHRWNRALHAEGRVLSAESYRELVTPQGVAAEHDYGLGVFRETLRDADSIQHSGGINGFNTYLLFLPETQTSVVVLRNADDGLPGLSVGIVANRLAAMAIGRPYLEPLAEQPAADTLAGYEGVYLDEEGKRYYVRVADERLTLQPGPTPRVNLAAAGDDLFLADEDLSRLAFERDASGAIVSLHYAAEDQGDGVRAALIEKTLPERVAIELEMPRILDLLTGRYVADGRTLDITAQEGRLHAAWNGQSPRVFLPESLTAHFTEEGDATLTFTMAGAAVRSVELVVDGVETTFVRAVE